VKVYEYLEKDSTLYIIRAGETFVVANSILSKIHNSIYTTFVSVYTNMFGICKAGFAEAWSN
jgi:hypothetical protein